MCPTPMPEPAKGVLAVMRISVRRVAEEAGVSIGFASRALNGYVTPSPKVRSAVQRLTGRPASDLFRETSS